MVLHCAAGDEPWVYYRFAGGPWQKIQIKAAPIDVIIGAESVQTLWTGTISTTKLLIIPANQKRISVSLLNNPGGILVKATREDKTWNFLVGRNVFKGYTGRFDISAFNGSGYIEVSENFPAGGDEIKITYQGSLMFSKTGKAPCEYKVACADCPPGFLKCERASGHYCMPLSEVQPSIAYIKSNLRNR